MFFVISVTDEVMERLCAVCASQRNTVMWAEVTPGSLVALLLRADVRCLLLLLRHALSNLFCRQLLGKFYMYYLFSVYWYWRRIKKVLLVYFNFALGKLLQPLLSYKICKLKSPRDLLKVTF